MSAPFGSRFLTAYLVVTAVLVLLFASLVVLGGRAALFAVQDEGKGSISVLFNFAVFWISWFLIGIALALGRRPAFSRRHAVFLIVFGLSAFSYLGTVREPHRIVMGDFLAYFRAAECVRDGVPIDQQPDRYYLYPPFLAVALSPLTPLGLERVLHAFHLANYVATMLLFVLLYLSLQRFRVARTLAALATFAIFAANVPLMRTLIYHQVNVHVANLVLLCFLLRERHPVWSAIALCLAIHVKVYPLVLAAPFLIERQWRWCVAFVAAHAAVVLGTLAVGGPVYYAQFFERVGALTETVFRASSVDSFLHNTLRLLHVEGGGAERPVALALRIALGALYFAAYWRMRGSALFADGDRAARGVANGFVALPALMFAVSPSVWSHHFVLMMMPMLVLATAIRTAGEACLWGLSYAFIFLVPIFDIYPVSYERLAAVLMLLALTRRLGARGGDGAPQWLSALNARAEALAG
jgi:alpha-1,2-mannosyltransferase